MTDKTAEIFVDTTPETDTPVVKNYAGLITKNKELLANLAETTTALKTAQDALGSAQASATDWQARWHKTAVLDVLEAELKAVSAGPIKYMRDVVTELGLLKIMADKEGIERPVWFDERAQPADLSKGLYKFLCGVSERGGEECELGKVLRCSGASGGGMSQSGSGAGRITQNATPVPTPAAPISLGLR